MTLGVVKRTEDDLAEWLGTEAGASSAACARYDDEPVVLEPYQLAFLRQPLALSLGHQEPPGGLLASSSRSRRWPAATCATGTPRSSSPTTRTTPRRRSWSPGRSSRSCRWPTRSGWSSTRRPSWPSSPTARARRMSRIISVPSKPPRGKKGDVYLDELAHYVNDREVYRARPRSSCARTVSSPAAPRRSAGAASSGRSPPRSCASTRTTAGRTCRGGCAASSAAT